MHLRRSLEVRNMSFRFYQNLMSYYYHNFRLQILDPKSSHIDIYIFRNLPESFEASATWSEGTSEFNVLNWYTHYRLKHCVLYSSLHEPGLK
jgi:hypothetical protein